MTHSCLIAAQPRGDRRASAAGAERAPDSREGGSAAGAERAPDSREGGSAAGAERAPDSREGGSAASGIPRRARDILVLLAAIALAVLPPGAARASDPEVFTVRGVTVDATAGSAIEAREQALAAGQAAALGRLFTRLTLASDRQKLPVLGIDRINDLVKDFEVSDEKTSAVRYLASLTVRFKPDIVRTFLREQGTGFAESPSKPLLVLPVMEVAGALALWDDPNPWREAWNRLPPSDGLVPLVRANGDLQDVAIIGAEQAVRGDAGRLAAIAGRYGAADVLVARAGMRSPEGAMIQSGSGPWLQVTLSRIGVAPLEQARVEAFHPEAGESMEALLARAAQAIAAQVQEEWKRNNRLRFDTGDELNVDVRLTSLAQWLEIKAKLETVPFIRQTNLTFLSRKGARIRLNFIGDEEQLRLALIQNDLVLERSATSLVLRLRTSSSDGDNDTTKTNVP
jgi:hypothetical protein